MGNAFKPLRFTGTVVTVASFAFQIVPVVITYLSPPYDIEYRLFLVFAIYVPAALVFIVLQARFLANAIENLQLFNTGITAEPNYAWGSAIPFVNFFITPWLLFTVHERTMSLSPQSGNTPDRSGYLTLACWGTFIGAIAINALAEGQPTPDTRVGGMLLGTAVGMVASALTKRIIGEIVQTQEARAGLGSTPAAAKPAKATPPAKPADEALAKPLAPEPAPPSPSKQPEVRVEKAEAKAVAPPRAKPLEAEADDTIALCPKCGAGTLASESTAGIVACPMCGNIFDADIDAGKEPTPPIAVETPVATTPAPAAKLAEAERGKPEQQLRDSAQSSDAVIEARPPAPLGWKLAALGFALAAPIGTFVLASEWRDVPDELIVRNRLMLRAGAVALAITLAVAVGIVKIRGKAMSGVEASLLWLGSALTLAMAVGIVFNEHGWVELGDGPDKYFLGGLPFGLALATVSGVVLRRRWHRSAQTVTGPDPGNAPGEPGRIRRRLLMFVVVLIIVLFVSSIRI